MEDIVRLSATELLSRLKSRRIGALELLEAYIRRIARCNETLNAVVAVDYENARVQARKADEALAKGKNSGPLHGLPVTIKESIAVAGMPLSMGSPDRKHERADRHADVVQSLVNAGAIVVGKTNLPFFGMDFQSYNAVYGQTNNPWNVLRTPGGSSGGAAAALAAGMSALDIGSDIGGSIRIPAHFCGVFGHKPTFNIVSMQGHFPFPGPQPRNGGMGDDMLVIGPLARSAKDIEQVMPLITGPAKTERSAWRLDLPKPRKSTLKDYRVGLWVDDPACPVDSRVGDRIQMFVDELSRHVSNIAEQKPAVDFSQSHALYVKLAAAFNGSTLPNDVFKKIHAESKRIEGQTNDGRAKFVRGAVQLHYEWMSLNQERLYLQRQWASFFREVDVLLMPVAPVAAFAHDHTPFYDRKLMVNGREVPYADTLYAWAGLSGVVYLPATVIPIGLNAEGLPVGIQIVGPYLEDRTTIHVATLIESAMGGFVPPQLP